MNLYEQQSALGMDTCAGNAPLCVPEPMLQPGFAPRRCKDPALNAEAAKGEVKAPVVLWGPYLWGDGTTPRKDGLVWNRDDLRDNDGTHPSDSGRQKVADMLMKFVHSDPYAKSWYLK